MNAKSSCQGWIVMLLATASLAASGCQPAVPPKPKPLVRAYPNEDYNASPVQILAHRDRYHGNKVQVMGYLVLEFEGTALYLHEDDANYGISRNGFWVDFDEEKVPSTGRFGPMEFHRKYVLIEGTFNKDKMGHQSSWQGTIEKIDRIYELEKRDWDAKP